MCQKHLHILPIFASWKVDPTCFSFVIFKSYISSFTWLLFTFRVTKFSARFADAHIRGSFFVSTLETLIWSLVDSLHILYQLRYMVS